MTTRHVAGRVRAFGGRLQTKVRRFFEPPLGPDARPLEIRAAVLDAIEQQVAPVGDGRRVLPCSGITARVLAPAGNRPACEAAFADIAQAVRVRLAEVRCEEPAALAVDVRVLDEVPTGWEPGQLFALEYTRAPEAEAAALPSPPGLVVTVTAGTATEPAYTLTSGTVLVGRGLEPSDQAGRVRRNHVAFVDGPGDVAETVGRAHARFSWDAEDGGYRVYDEGSSNGTQVLRDGTTIPVRRRDPRGVRLRSGDEVQFGRARVRIRVLTEAG